MLILLPGNGFRVLYLETRPCAAIHSVCRAASETEAHFIFGGKNGPLAGFLGLQAPLTS